MYMITSLKVATVAIFCIINCASAVLATESLPNSFRDGPHAQIPPVHISSEHYSSVAARRDARNPTRTPAMAPTSCATDEGLVWYINNITLSGRKLTLNESSPEENALFWLLVEPLQLKPCTAADKFRIRQRFALFTLWFQQQRRGQIEKWNNKWLITESECTWYGISCTQRNFGDGIGLQLAVTNITLVNNNMYGTIPPDLGHLSVLRHLLLSGNKLNGTIPNTIGRWSDLQVMSLSNNPLLSGSIPPSVGNFTDLATFELAMAGLTGPLPSTVGFWSKLLSLSVAFNALSGPIPSEIGNWKYATSLSFANNFFSGSIPSTLSQLKQIQGLYLSSNKLTGFLPPSIGQLSNIVNFLVEENQLVGTIPASISSWRDTVKIASFHQNNLTGTVNAGVCGKSAYVRVSCPGINITGCMCCICAGPLT